MHFIRVPVGCKGIVKEVGRRSCTVSSSRTLGLLEIYCCLGIVVVLNDLDLNASTLGELLK